MLVCATLPISVVNVVFLQAGVLTAATSAKEIIAEVAVHGLSIVESKDWMMCNAVERVANDS